HVGVFAEQSSSRRDHGAVSADAGGSTTSTSFDLAGRTYRPGDCVTWDQDVEGSETRATRIVSCDKPHLIEMTGRWVMPILKSYPTDEEWDRLLADGDCGKQAAVYLGGEIDPYGRFDVGAIRPTFRGWAGGDREVWCGVQLTRADLRTDPNVLGSFTGKVQSQPQGFVSPAGACLAGDPATRSTTGQVHCTDPHIYEVVGDIDAGAAFSTPPAMDSSLWNEKLAPK